MPWTRRRVLRGAAAAGVVGCTPRAPAGSGTDTWHPPGGGSGGTTDTPTPQDTGTRPTNQPPNIVYIFSDQHRGGLLGAAGHALLQTPHIDALAAEGVTFTNAFSNSPLCVPARNVMMTGWMPHVTGSWMNEQFADPFALTNHVQRLRDEAGYHTAVIGKIHLYNVRGDVSTPEYVGKAMDWGFVEVFELLSQPDVVTQPNPYSLWLTGLTPSGETDKAVRYANYVNEFDYFSSPAIDEAPYNLVFDENYDVYTGRLARDWILARTDPAPFYLQINFPGPHKPFDSTVATRALYDMTDPLFGTAILGAPPEPRSPLVQYVWQEKGLQGMTAEESQYMMMQYYAKISLIDTIVGEIVAALRDTGRLDNTWIVYSADHGEMLGDHEIWGKVVMYEGSIRIPLVIRPPGGAPPWVAQGMTDQKDITASILEMAGLDPTGLPGRSLVPKVVMGAGATDAQVGKDSVFAEIIGDPVNVRFQVVMVRDARYKVQFDVQMSTPTEVYDLVEDPDELVNLVSDPDYVDIIAERVAQIEALVQEEVPTETA